MTSFVIKSLGYKKCRSTFLLFSVADADSERDEHEKAHDHRKRVVAVALGVRGVEMKREREEGSIGEIGRRDTLQYSRT